MYRILSGMRVVEAASFVAAPSCGLYLAQMGAEVIRFDQVGGGPDFRRWPRAENGASFFWEALNKGKKSVAIDLGRPEGRELAAALVTAPGAGRGLFVTNFPVGGFLAHDRLAARRPDLVTVRVMGRADGGQAVDYTVNCEVGIPMLTGEPGGGPVNHVLPAWDLLTGAYAAFAMLAAERQRRESGHGQEVRIPLADMAITSIANLGMLSEVLAAGADRPRYGNELFGAFGRDFPTADGHRIMIAAITPRQWSDLIQALGLGAAVAAVEAERGVSFATDEGQRFLHRDRLMPLVAEAIARRSRADLAAAFAGTGVCWGDYRSVLEAAHDPALVTANPVFAPVEQVSGVVAPAPGAAATFVGAERGAPVRAPRLGEHTDEVLAEVVGLGSGEIGRLHDSGIVQAG